MCKTETIATRVATTLAEGVHDSEKKEARACVECQATASRIRETRSFSGFLFFGTACGITLLLSQTVPFPEGSAHFHPIRLIACLGVMAIALLLIPLIDRLIGRTVWFWIDADGVSHIHESDPWDTPIFLGEEHILCGRDYSGRPFKALSKIDRFAIDLFNPRLRKGKNSDWLVVSFEAPYIKLCDARGVHFSCKFIAGSEDLNCLLRTVWKHSSLVRLEKKITVDEEYLGIAFNALPEYLLESKDAEKSKLAGITRRFLTAASENYNSTRAHKKFNHRAVWERLLGGVGLSLHRQDLDRSEKLVLEQEGEDEKLTAASSDDPYPDVAPSLAADPDDE